MKIAKLIIALSVAIWLAVPVYSQDHNPVPGSGPGMKMHEDVLADMKAMDEKLDKLVIDMNTATTPEKKLDAAIAVLNEMVTQHKKMHAKAAQHWEHHHAGSSASPMSEEPKKQ